MYLREFSLGNFKAFGPTQTLPIRPLTLIFGPNSGGKSSLIHGLLLAHDAQNARSLNVHYPRIAGKAVDIGGFRQYVFRHATEHPVEWALSARIPPKHKLSTLTSASTVTIRAAIGMRHTVADASGEPLPTGDPRILSYVVELDGVKVVAFSHRMVYDHLKLDMFDVGQPCVQKLLKAAADAMSTKRKQCTEADARSAFDKLKVDIKIEDLRLIPEETSLGATEEECPVRDVVDSVKRWTQSDVQSEVELLRQDMEDAEPEDADAYGVLDTWLRWTWDLFRREFLRFDYIGPFRKFPPRKVDESLRNDPDYFSGGLFAWDRIHTDDELRGRVNEWLSRGFMQTPYRFEVRRAVTLEDLLRLTGAGELPARMRDREDYLEQLFHKADTGRSEMFLADRLGIELAVCDVGTGISQVVPVLVEAMGSTDRTVAIEQPELHLHPALQAELGDVFINSALGKAKNTFLLETHSEHLVLRILRRIRETTELGDKLPEGQVPIRPDDVSVVYVEPTPKGAVVHRLPVTEDGDFAVKWPGGFFAERAGELF